MQPAEKLAAIPDELVRRALGQVGQRVRDRWRLDAVLGVGGTAAVFAATHRNGKRVALKILHAELSANLEARQRFLDEGYVANRVGHPGAVSVIDDDVTEDGHPFLIMDLLEGETLDQEVGQGGWLSPARVLTIAEAVLDILAAAHEKGIVHRDVKPDNIFVTRDGKVRLLDFGIARVTAPRRLDPIEPQAPLGTPAFMSPEQARGLWEQLDGRSDLWSLGATMFLLLTGRDVHETSTVDEELLAAMTKQAPSLGAVAPYLPRPLIDVVDRALAFERNDRWAGAREMQAAVRRVGEILGSGPLVPTTQASMVVQADPSRASSADLVVQHGSATDTPAFHLVARRRAKRSTPDPAIADGPAPPPWRLARPLVVVAVSAVVSFATLIAVRELSKTWRGDAAEGAAVSTVSTAPKTPVVQPKPLSTLVEEARTWVASELRSPPAASSGDEPNEEAPAESLDERK